MPTSDRKAADVTTAAAVVVVAGGGLRAGVRLLLPVTSPRLAAVLHSPVTIAVFCVLVAGTALNVLTDSVFLAINRVRSTTCGSTASCSASSSARCRSRSPAPGPSASTAPSAAPSLSARAASLVGDLPARPRAAGRCRPSRALPRRTRFAGAGYVTYVLTRAAPAGAPAAGDQRARVRPRAAYFISVQIVTLQNAVILAVGNSMYAESERARTGRRHLVAQGGTDPDRLLGRGSPC